MPQRAGSQALLDDDRVGTIIIPVLRVINSGLGSDAKHALKPLESLNMATMTKNLSLCVLVMIGTSAGSLASDNVRSPSHGIPYPEGWKDWATIAVSHRTDNNTLRVIVGNGIAVEAARHGKTDPWPDGAVLGKVVWKDTQLENWQAATAPGEFVHAEFMFKDSERYAETYGWGWARWVGFDQAPFDGGMQVCITCHTPVKQRDCVFTDPAKWPD